MTRDIKPDIFVAR